MKIVAKGVYLGEDATVECEFLEEFVVRLNGEIDENLKSRILNFKGILQAIGGTYYPPEGSPFRVYSFLKWVLFDTIPEISAEGFETIPQIDGVVY